LTIWARRATWRRSAWVSSSGSQHDGKKFAAQQLREDWASTLSVLTLASAIPRVFIGFDTTTRATCCSSSRAMACVLTVASSETSPSDARLCANSRSAFGVTVI
jgi:hypothetical protein